MSVRILIFDDVVFARGETFNIPGVLADLYEHADDAVELAAAIEPDYIFMDYAMGPTHVTGSVAVANLRGAGYAGTIIAMSSDPDLNDEMIAAGANERLAKKALLRSYLMDLGSRG